MALNIFVENDTLFLDYSPDFENNWVFGELETSEKVIIKKVFEFKKSDLYEKELVHFTSENSSIFVLGELDISKKYFVIKGHKLGIPYDIYFDKSINIISDYFIGIRDISIFKNI